MRPLRCLWIRLNVVTGWPVLFVLDVLIAATGVDTWPRLRRRSRVSLARIWRLHARPVPPPDRVQFDRNGVASVDVSDLLRSERVQAQFRAGRRIVEAHRRRDHPSGT